ncbi:hypothetical protein AB0G00_23900 [Nocardia salmonicida]|uniref:hypothetical protein n=1 Tax=Nocardia salmonicida TaxID=53431 RepID=UPI0033C67778
MELSPPQADALRRIYRMSSNGEAVGDGDIRRNVADALKRRGLCTITEASSRYSVWRVQLTEVGFSKAAEAELLRLVERLESADEFKGDKPAFSATDFDLDAVADAVHLRCGSYDTWDLSALDFWTLAAEHKKDK